MLSRWLFVRGIVKQEFWNEPDLTAGSSEVGATCMSPSRWLEQYTVRAQAVQNAYADYNADVASGAMACPALVDRSMHASGAPNCPFKPALTTAFASRTFKGEPASPGEFFGHPTVKNQQLKFPPYLNASDPTWANLGAYAYHSYGKEGYDLAKATIGLQATTNAELPAGSPSLSLLTTEHASKTASSWNLADSSSDDPYEAARLASQLIWMSNYGLETYTFKMSSTPSNNFGIVKSGLHWGENSVFPYPIGDTTRSGEAARMVISSMVGRTGSGKLPLYSCVTSTGSAFRPCNLVNDNGVLTMVIVNDAVLTGASSKAPVAFAMKVSLAAMATQLGLVNGVVAVVNELSTAGYNNEVSSLQPLYANNSWSFTVMLPKWAVMSITLPTGAQTNTALAPTADTSLFATGVNAAAQGASSTLTVGTSVTSVHDTTSVALLRFNTAATASTAISSALLELTVTAAPSAANGPSLMSIYALNAAAAAAWAENTATWATASAAPMSLLNATVSGVIDSVVENFVNHASGISLAGHIMVSPGDVGALKRVDVTDSVRNTSVVAFAIVRRMRNNLYTGNTAPAAGIPADRLSGGAAVSFASKEAASAASRPALRILVNGAPASALPQPRAAQLASPRMHADDDDYDAPSTSDLSDVAPDYIVVSNISSIRAQSGEAGACASWESPMLDHYVTVTGTVIAVFNSASDSGQYGFVLQDSTAPFSGLLVQLSAEQAGLLTSGTGFLPVPGNVVRVDGVVGHQLGNTILEQVSGVTVVTPLVALPTPVTVTASSLASGCSLLSEQYRNMVVQLNQLRFTINPTDMTTAEYAAAVANFGTATFDLDTDGELYVAQTGGAPVQLDNKMFDVVASLGWASSPSSCGAKLGDLIDTLVGVAVFDDTQSKVSYEMGNPPTMELNIIKINSSMINPCAALPPAASPALNASTSAAATLTLSGINSSTFDLVAARTAIATLFGAFDTVTVAAIQFPIASAAFSFTTNAPLDGALAANVRTALQRAFASFNAPLLPSNLQLRGPEGAMGRRHLASSRAVFGLDVNGVRSAYTANLVTTGLAGMLAPALGSRGLVSKLTALGVLNAASASLDTVPTVSAVLTVTVTYATPPLSPAAALAAALTPAAVSRVLATAGVAFTGVSLSLDRAVDDDHRDAIIGGVIGGFFGLVLLVAAAVLVVRRFKVSAVSGDGKPPPSPPLVSRGQGVKAEAETETVAKAETVAVVECVAEAETTPCPT